MQPQVEAPPPVLVDNSRQKRLLIIIGLIIVVAIILFGGIVLFMRSNQTSQVNSVTPTPSINSPTITLVPTKVPTIDMTLEKGKVQTIPGTTITIEYLGANIPNPNCADCSSTTNILLQKGGVDKTLNFLCGGIAGKCLDKLSEFDYEVTLTSGTETTAKVSIKQQ